MRDYKVRNHQRVGALTEVKKDLNIAKKYLLYFSLIALVISMLIYYNTLYIKKEKVIVQLNQQKNLLKVENLKLERDITVLSAPSRIEKIAKEKLKMIPVTYDSISFIPLDE
ncbi:MAG: cell division protein FtsL [Aquificae bacterium]|nr:cell division protein FtsL [Aquificota bacterium]